MTDHLRIHVRPEDLTCPHCKRIFRYNSSFKLHIAKAHLTTGSKCEPCNLFFDTPQKLETHKYTYHAANTFACPQCDKRYLSKNALRQHRALHAAKIENCPICGKEFRGRRNLKSHVDFKHSDKFQCDVCRFSIGIGLAFRRHMETHEANDQKAVGTPEAHLCHLCAEQFNSRGRLNRHLRTVHEAHDSSKEDLVGSTSSPGHQPEDHPKLPESEAEIGKGATTTTNYLCGPCDRFFPTDAELQKHFDAAHPAAHESQDWNGSNTEAIDLDHIPQIFDEINIVYPDYEEAGKICSIDKEEDAVEKGNTSVEEMAEITICSKSPKMGLTLEQRKAYISQYDTYLTYKCEECLDDKHGEFLKLHSFEEMRKHFRDTHNSGGYAFCCGKRISKRALTMHIKSHTTSTTCPVCSMVFAAPNTMARHLRNTHKQMPKLESAALMSQYDKIFEYRCEDCDVPRELRDFSEMRTHFRTQHLQQSIGYVFCCGRKIPRPMCRGHLGYHLTPEKYTCPKCQAVMPSIPRLGHHIKRKECGRLVKKDPKRKSALAQTVDAQGTETEYNRLFKYFCEECQSITGEFKQLSNYKEMQTHFVQLHRQQGYGFCCNRKIPRKFFAKHVQQYHKHIRYDCQLCEKSYAKKSDLVTHIRVVHEKVQKRRSVCDRRRCGLCDIRFDTYEEFTNHRKMNHMSEMTCELCGITKANIKLLRQHIKQSHPTEGTTMEDLVCPHCSKLSKTKEALRLHIRNNHSNPDLLCSLCAYTTKFKRCLELHLANHEAKHREKSDQ